MEKRTYRRPRKAPRRRKEGARSETDFARPKLDPGLRAAFDRIGVPEPEPFRPDPFQKEALGFIGDHDVLVSAPTGAGKTWIASQTIHSYLEQGLKVWYASPLKALSNSIYQEFCREFGSHSCGILTGDRKENLDAPVIVGTTEILRNQLYDAMHQGASIQTDLVILDEAHYLSDPDRGVVWEEVLIYLPSRVRLLLLSATVSNGEEVCSWLEEIRGTPNRVVLSGERPVPLEMLFLFPDGRVASLGSKRGLNPKVRKFMPSGSQRFRKGSDRLDFGRIIKCLRDLDLLPAIFFLKSRADCDRALRTCPPVRISPEARGRMRATLKSFLKEFPHLEGHRQMGSLRDCLVGSHHGGQLPYWKVLVERVMERGYLEAIFSTSTVAAGVNFPARTVVLLQSDRYNGHDFVDLTATDLHQMIGRAGRRGKDLIGFALVVPGRHQDPQLICNLEKSPPEPLMSQIHINFSMTLNLLLSHSPFEVRDLLERSFAAFQDRGSPGRKERRERLLSRLKGLLPDAECNGDDPYEILEYIQRRAELRREIRRLSRGVGLERLVRSHETPLQPGRLFLHRNGDIYVIFETLMERGRFLCLAHSIRKRVRTRRGGLQLKRVDLRQIRNLLDYRISLPRRITPRSVMKSLEAIPVQELRALDTEDADRGEVHDALGHANKQLLSLPCEACAHRKLCHGKKKGELWALLNEFRTASGRLPGVGGGLWPSFRKHLRFLKETGFADQEDRLTPDGYWASKLRLDHPLLIAEAIRKGALEGVSPEGLAAGLAPFVWDRDIQVELHSVEGLDLGGPERIFTDMLTHIEHIRALKEVRGFENPPVLFWPAAALFMWARGMPWEELLNRVPVNEGDMASLIMRTADHLRQVINLRETHSRLADVAQEAVELVMREPVYIE